MGAQRRIVVFERVSADGYFTTQDGDGRLDWAVQDPEVDQLGVAGIPSVDTILFGRKTYEMFAAFWPRVAAAAPGVPADPHGRGQPSRPTENRAFASVLDESPKLVFSRTLERPTWKNTRVLRELDPREIAAWKRQPGKDMIVFGSGSIVSELTRHGLVDEYQLVVSPVLLGGGRPLVSGVAERARLALLEARAFRSGNVLLRYARAGTA